MAKLHIEGVEPTEHVEQKAQEEEAVSAPATSAAKVSSPKKPVAPAEKPSSQQAAKPASAAKPQRPRIVSEPAPDPASRSAAQEGARKEPARPTLPKALAWIERIAPGHVNAVLGGFAGLIVALMVFVVGLWQTLFVCALVVVGVAVGQYLDGDPKIVNMLRSLLEDERGDGQG